jgi:glycosyltransferase involved in cell wall biosynthesis
MSSIRKINLNQVKRVEYDTAADGTRSLKLPPITEENLPCVSVLTITKNRKRLFPLVIYNWQHILYPKSKLEWIILNNSDQKDQDLKDILPNDDRIKYYTCPPGDVGDLRNKCVELASYEYCVHFDDDDYIFPDSILARIRCMLHYKKEFIYSNNLGIYDTVSKTSAIGENSSDVGELTICFTKNFWREGGKFCRITGPHIPKGIYEAYKLCHKREKKMIHIDFWFNMISVTHKGNFTGRLRSVNQCKDAPSFYDLIFPEEFKKLLDDATKEETEKTVTKT